MVLNEEVARAVDDAVDLVRVYLRENLGEVTLDEQQVGMFRSYYSRRMYQVRAGTSFGEQTAGRAGDRASL